jgi:hypothetical protein
MAIAGVLLAVLLVVIVGVYLVTRARRQAPPPHAGSEPTVEETLTGESSHGSTLPPPGSGGDTRPTGIDEHAPHSARRRRPGEA